MQISRKNIIITSMILLLFVVGYAYNMFTTDNYIGVNYDLGMDEMTAKEAEAQETPDAPADVQASVETKAEGDTAAVVEKEPEAVEATSSAASTFFSEYRIEREKNRSKEVEMWQEVISNQNTEQNFKTLANQELVKIIALTEKEMIIENMIISLGFSDALAFITDDSATILVETKDLSPSQVASIQDIVVRKTKLNPTNIKIMKKN